MKVNTDIVENSMDYKQIHLKKSNYHMVQQLEFWVSVPRSWSQYGKVTSAFYVCHHTGHS